MVQASPLFPFELKLHSDIVLVETQSHGDETQTHTDKAQSCDVTQQNSFYMTQAETLFVLLSTICPVDPIFMINLGALW